MEFEQKAEEKKMSMSKNIARLAVTAGLTAALSFGGAMAPVTMAFAADAAAATTNSVTIKKNVKNGDVKYKAYQIFAASVVNEGEKKVVSDVNWADGLSDAAKNGIISAIKKDTNGDKLSPDPSAQDVADWMTTYVLETNPSTRVDKDHVLNKIAKAIKDNGVSPKGMVQPGVAYIPDTNGYYLFLTDESTLNTPAETGEKVQTGTSPIFAIVGDKSVTVTEKTSIPTVDKQIFNANKNKTAENASDGDWAYVGDSQIGQDVDYKLTGTVADNIASYTEYEYKFQDTLSKGLVVTKDENDKPKDLHVYIVNGKNKIEVKDGFEATVTPASETQNGELLTVHFKDLKSVKDGKINAIAVDKDSNVVVTYKAHLTKDASYEVDGNTNTVKLVYSNNPMGEGTGTSAGKTVTDYAFRLDVTKVDSENQNEKLVAGFKVKVVTNEGNASVDKWLSADGSLVNEEQAHEFTTDESTGRVYIPGLVTGTYQITETTTPAGYNTIAPFTITVTPQYVNGKLDKLTVDDNSGMVDPGNATGATIPVTVKNKKGSGLPLTGLNGVTFTWIAGGAVLCIGVAHLIRSRKQAEESEQE